MSESEEELKKQIAELKAQLESEKASSQRSVYLQVSKKGGVSLYGIRRFPITFYLEEWNRILGMESEIRAFLEEHKAELTTRD
jgi:hypothetical protein